jgi:hypothetical protein
MPRNGSTLPELIDVTNAGLLQAKTQGKNQQMRIGTPVHMLSVKRLDSARMDSSFVLEGHKTAGFGA